MPNQVMAGGAERETNKRLASHTAVMFPKDVCSHHRSTLQTLDYFRSKH